MKTYDMALSFSYDKGSFLSFSLTSFDPRASPSLTDDQNESLRKTDEVVLDQHKGTLETLPHPIRFDDYFYEVFDPAQLSTRCIYKITAGRFSVARLKDRHNQETRHWAHDACMD